MAEIVKIESASELLAFLAGEILSNKNLSIRGVARCCDVSPQSIIEGAHFKSAKLAQTLTDNGFEAAHLLRDGFPPKAVWLCIEYFAYESKADAPRAKQLARTFGAIGLTTTLENLHQNPFGGQKFYTLEMTVRRDPATWERMFSPTWIDCAEKITGWSWSWSCMGRFINDTVYAYLPCDVVEALRELNPRIDDRRGRSHKHHQFLQPEIRSIVSSHLDEVETLMLASKGNKELFSMLMANKYGRFRLSGEDDELPLFRTETVFVVSPRISENNTGVTKNAHN